MTHNCLHSRAVTEIDDRQRGPLAVPPCPVCGGSSAIPTFEITGLAERVVVCDGCGLGRLHPQPDVDRIREFYPQEYYGHSGTKFTGAIETIVGVVAGRQARYVARGLPPGARILDVGCGRGVLLGALLKRGCEAHGVELSRDAALGADPAIAIRIVPKLRDAGFSDGYFDRVILWHVLEHLPDPRETLLEIRRILKPGGKVIVAVPNFSSWQARWAGAAWFHLDLPRHLFHFPLPSLRRLLKSCGFHCGAEHHFSLRQNPFGWLQSALNRYTALPRNGLYELMHRRSGDRAPLFDSWTRFRMQALFCLGVFPAMLLSVLAALFRSGATVHVEATAE